MPARRVINKPLVKEYINRIYAETRLIFRRLDAGLHAVASVKSENSLNRVLLLTDGEPTSGNQGLLEYRRSGCRAEKLEA